MPPDEIAGIAVSATIVLGALWRGLKAAHKIASLMEHLIDRVTALEKSLSNGIRSDIRRAAEQADKASVLAAEAAKQASVAQQLAVEGRREMSASFAGLRAEIDVMTNVAMTDHAQVWEVLSAAGLDRRSGDAG